MSNDDFSVGGSEHLQLCLERDRLLCTPEFSRSPVMSKLLSFLVAYKLEGNTQPLKAYSIAVEALGRSEDFDPQTDSYPRVIMGRLRKLIDNHYLRNPSSTRLSIPLNQYEVVLEGASSDEPPKAMTDQMPLEGALVQDNGVPAAPIVNDASDHMPVGSQQAQASIAAMSASTMPTPTMSAPTASAQKAPTQSSAAKTIIAIAVILGLIAMIIGIISTQGNDKPILTDIDYPTIRVVDVTDDDIAESIGEQASAFFKSSLVPFGGIEVVVSRPNDTIKSDYLLIIEAVDIAGGRLNLRLIRDQDNELIWSRILAVPEDVKTIRPQLEQAVAALVGPSGAVIRDQTSQHRESFAAGYHCALQADSYLKFREKELLQPVIECMTKTVEQFPDDPYLLEKKSFVIWIAQRQSNNVDFDETGQDLATRALRVNPNSAYAAFAEARASYFAGKCRRGDEWAKKATTANPLDSRLLGYHAIYLAGCNDERAESLAERAIALDPDVDLGVYAVLALLRYKQGNFEEAYRLSNRKLVDSTRVDPGLQITRALSALAIGKRQEAENTWQRLNLKLGLPEDAEPALLLETYIVNPNLRAAVLKEFSKYDFP